MGAAARGGEQPTLEHAWSSMLAIVTMRAGRRPCWARRAIISGLLIGTVAPDFFQREMRRKRGDEKVETKDETKKMRRTVYKAGCFWGFQLLVWWVRWQPVAFLEAGSQNLGEYPSTFFF